MKRYSKLLISTAAASLGLALATLSATANPNHDQKPVISSKTAVSQMDHGMMNGNMINMMHRLHNMKNVHMGDNMMDGHMGDNMLDGHMGDNMLDGHMGDNMLDGHMGDNMFDGHMGDIMFGSRMGDLQAFDTDNDGTINPEELRNGLLAELKKYDTNGDDALSIDEFETLYSVRIRNKMVDRFQALDEDGDSKVTEAEITARADKMKRRVQNHPSATHMNQMRQMHGYTPEYN